MNRLAAGAAAGVGATLTMSLAIALGRRIGLMRTPPPQEITRRGLRKTGVDVSHDDAGRLAWPAHLGYGAAMGALFGLVSNAVTDGRQATMVAAHFVYGATLDALLRLDGHERRG